MASGIQTQRCRKPLDIRPSNQEASGRLANGTTIGKESQRPAFQTLPVHCTGCRSRHCQEGEDPRASECLPERISPIHPFTPNGNRDGRNSALTLPHLASHQSCPPVPPVPHHPPNPGHGTSEKIVPSPSRPRPRPWLLRRCTSGAGLPRPLNGRQVR